jgi:hypothetical protein
MATCILDLPQSIIHIIANYLTPIDLIRFNNTCLEIKKIIGNEVTNLNLNTETGMYLTSKTPHNTIKNLWKVRKNLMYDFWFIKVTQKEITLKTSEFLNEQSVIHVNNCSIRIVVDISCRTCLIKALQFTANITDINQYIWIHDDNKLCPLQDDDIKILANFNGYLYIIDQPLLTDVGIMYLKNIRLLNISGCEKVSGGSLIKLMLHYMLCYVIILKSSGNSISKEYYQTISNIEQQGYVYLW